MWVQKSRTQLEVTMNEHAKRIPSKQAIYMSCVERSMTKRKKRWIDSSLCVLVSHTLTSNDNKGRTLCNLRKKRDYAKSKRSRFSGNSSQNCGRYMNNDSLWDTQLTLPSFYRTENDAVWLRRFLFPFLMKLSICYGNKQMRGTLMGKNDSFV